MNGYLGMSGRVNDAEIYLTDVLLTSNGWHHKTVEFLVTSGFNAFFLLGEVSISIIVFGSDVPYNVASQKLSCALDILRSNPNPKDGCTRFLSNPGNSSDSMNPPEGLSMTLQTDTQATKQGRGRHYLVTHNA
jgi:hypothetical protein